MNRNHLPGGNDESRWKFWPDALELLEAGIEIGLEVIGGLLELAGGVLEGIATLLGALG